MTIAYTAIVTPFISLVRDLVSDAADPRLREMAADLLRDSLEIARLNGHLQLSPDDPVTLSQIDRLKRSIDARSEALANIPGLVAAEHREAFLARATSALDLITGAGLSAVDLAVNRIDRQLERLLAKVEAR